MNNIKHTFTIAVLLLTAFLTSASVADAQTATTNAISANSNINTVETPAVLWPNIEAKSAFVYDPVGNVVLFEKNADVQRPTASLLKIMTAITADNILAKSPKLAEKKISIVNIKDEVPADFALPAKSTWYPDSLLQIMLLGSSNKAAETLASQLIPRSSFISLMNYHAKRLGLTSTYFKNPTGLTELGKVKATSTAGRLDMAAGVSTTREIAKMMWAGIAENPGLLDITREASITIPNKVTQTAQAKSKTATSSVITNTNTILKDFPILFSKTGFTENAGGNLAIVMQQNERAHPYIIVVMGSTQDKRFEDVAKLASTTLKFIALNNSFSTTTAMAR
ncbi:MAG: D-alanyl-D-alanine carboxypeptidase [Candidatus Pacebacteria bacterium]|nr:D-alanyl-D-alanine carboxypeptidase [Candidatus Paceibacterota bacterium]MBP9818933.1 D-alanyl-D-alanine carboxypeptidase [Candidatus Paceibacterota bacterium]